MQKLAQRFRCLGRSLIFMVTLLPCMAHGAAAAPAASRPAAQPAPLSAPARDFLARPVDRPSFERGLALAHDRKESVAARKQVIDKMHGARRTMDSAQLRAWQREAAALAKDPQSPPELAAEAVGAMTSANLLLEERGEITPAEARQEVPYLLETARDPGKRRELRGRAIRALGDLKVTEAAPVLQGLLEDPATANEPEVARHGCLALGRLRQEKALPTIAGVMARTSDTTVFGSGALALGRLKSPEAMAALVKLERRFPDSSSCDAALAGMDETILAVLRNPADPHLAQAIAATRHLWKKSQREQYVPLLRGLLRSAPPAARALALERLLEAAGARDFAAESKELETILPLIEDQPDLRNYAERIHRRLAAQPLAPTGQTIPVPADPAMN